MSDKLYIVMPAYNESANIEEVVERWHPIVQKISSDSRLVIIDDGSSDNTYNLMKSLEIKYSQFIPVTKKNSGHGSTCLFAYNYGINADADYIFQTDSDMQTNSEEFWSFWEKRNEYDFVIGSRKHRKDGLSRIVVTKILKLIVLLFFNENVEDSNCPFRLMNARKLIPVLKFIPDDFFLSNVIISMVIVKRNEKYLWLPISFESRHCGKNSINLKRIFLIGVKALADFKKVKKRL